MDFISTLVHWNDSKVFVDAYHKWTAGRSTDLFSMYHHYAHDTTPLHQEETCADSPSSGVGPSWEPDDTIGQQYGKMAIA